MIDIIVDSLNYLSISLIRLLNDLINQKTECKNTKTKKKKIKIPSKNLLRFKSPIGLIKSLT